MQIIKQKHKIIISSCNCITLVLGLHFWNLSFCVFLFNFAVELPDFELVLPRVFFVCKKGDGSKIKRFSFCSEVARNNLCTCLSANGH